jgi:hypothetical protein
VVAWVEPLEPDTVVVAALSVARLEVLLEVVVDDVSAAVDEPAPVVGVEAVVVAPVQAVRPIVLAIERATRPAVAALTLRRPLSRA